MLGGYQHQARRSSRACSTTVGLVTRIMEAAILQSYFTGTRDRYKVLYILTTEIMASWKGKSYAAAMAEQSVVIRGTEGRLPARYEARVSTVVSSSCHTTPAY